MRHLREMAKIAVSSHKFALEAGSTSLDSYVGEPDKAEKNLYDAVYGKASPDERASKGSRFKAIREYAKALAYNRKFQDSSIEYLNVLRQDSMDFAAAYSLLDLNSMRPSILLQPHELQSISSALQPIEAAFQSISSVAVNKYTGFVPPEKWHPRVWEPHLLSNLPTAKQFSEHVEQRQPWIIRLGSSLAKSLKWKTDEWMSEEYLIKKTKKAAGDGPNDVQIECKFRTSADSLNDWSGANGTQYGYSVDTFRKVVPFDRFLRGCYSTATEKDLDASKFNLVYKPDREKMSNLEGYMNTQRADMGEGIYRPPLDKLDDDIPLPGFLMGVNESMKDVTMWLGNAVNGPTTSKLHFDATDNLYVVLKGSKTFRILDPSKALLVRTMSPTFAVSPNGLSYQYKPMLLDAYLETDKKSAGKSGKKSGPKSKKTPLKAPKILTSSLPFEREDYFDAVNYHFSTLSDPRPEGGFGTTESERKAIEAAFITVTLFPGDMFYLPTGWFHEVSERKLYGNETLLLCNSNSNEHFVIVCLYL